MRVVAASVLLLGGAARAQDETFRQGQSIWVFNWEIAGPVGDFKHYVSDWSLRGFSLEGRFVAIDGLSIGLSASFNRWQQTYSQLSVPVTVNGATGVATGPVFRYNDMFGLRAL